jgi:hypothetical protein
LLAWSAAAAAVVKVLIKRAAVLVGDAYALALIFAPDKARRADVVIHAFAPAKFGVPVVTFIALLSSALEVADLRIRVEDHIWVRSLSVLAFAPAGLSVPNFLFVWNRSEDRTVQGRALAAASVEIEVVVFFTRQFQEFASAAGAVPVAWVGNSLTVDFLSSVRAVLRRADAFAFFIVPLLVDWTLLFQAVTAASRDIVVFASGARNLSLVACVRGDIIEFIPMALFGHGKDSASSDIPVKQVRSVDLEGRHALAIAGIRVEDSLLRLAIVVELGAVFGNALAFAV